MRFLVAVDGTLASERVVTHAAELARSTGGELVLAHAVEPSVQQVGDGPIQDGAAAENRLVQESTEAAEQRGEEVLEQAAARVEGALVTTELLYGAPAESVATFAGESGVDGVVVGHRDLSEQQERVLGSVAKRLVELSPVPVTVVS
jgi:nucleotide-binding universal stress UspA family protein